MDAYPKGEDFERGFPSLKAKVVQDVPWDMEPGGDG